jgi:hypothetical protein
MPEGFPRMGIRQVHFDQHSSRSDNHLAGVAHRVRVVGKGSRVQNHGAGRIRSFVKPPDECRFIIGLSEIELNA